MKMIPTLIDCQERDGMPQNNKGRFTIEQEDSIGKKQATAKKKMPLLTNFTTGANPRE
jgi:hypothetical protein